MWKHEKAGVGHQWLEWQWISLLTGFFPWISLGLGSDNEAAPALLRLCKWKRHSQSGGTSRTPDMQTKAKNTKAAKQQCQENLLRWSNSLVGTTSPWLAYQLPRCFWCLSRSQAYSTTCRALGCCSNYRKSQRHWIGWQPGHQCPRHNAGPLGNTNQPHLCYPAPWSSAKQQCQSIFEEPEKTTSFLLGHNYFSGHLDYPL